MAEVNQTSSLNRADTNAVLDAIVADMTAIRTKANLAISDLGTMRTAVNLAISKLNADGGVSDTDYAAITTLGSSAITALTTTVD